MVHCSAVTLACRASWMARSARLTTLVSRIATKVAMHMVASVSL
jgi:hypothetical protein